MKLLKIKFIKIFIFIAIVVMAIFLIKIFVDKIFVDKIFVDKIFVDKIFVDKNKLNLITKTILPNNSKKINFNKIKILNVELYLNCKQELIPRVNSYNHTIFYLLNKDQVAYVHKKFVDKIPTLNKIFLNDNLIFELTNFLQSAQLRIFYFNKENLTNIFSTLNNLLTTYNFEISQEIVDSLRREIQNKRVYIEELNGFNDFHKQYAGTDLLDSLSEKIHRDHLINIKDKCIHLLNAYEEEYVNLLNQHVFFNVIKY